MYSCVRASSDWTHSSGWRSRASGWVPNSLPSRLTPTLNRGSAAITCTAVAPPRECPTIPTWRRSRCPASGERRFSVASAASRSSTKPASAARMSMSRWSSGCGGGPITSGCTVWPTTRPSDQHRGRRLVRGAQRDDDEAAARQLGAQGRVLLARHPEAGGEHQDRPRPLRGADRGPERRVGVDLAEGGVHERRQPADRAGEPVLGLEVGDGAPTGGVGGIPRLCDDLAMIGGIGRQPLRPRGVGPAEDLAGDPVGARRRGQSRHERRRQRQPGDDHAESERAAAEHPHRPARAPGAPPAQGGGDADADGERPPRDHLPARTGVEDHGRGRQRRSDGGEALQRSRSTVAGARPPQRADEDDGDEKTIEKAHGRRLVAGSRCDIGARPVSRPGTYARAEPSMSALAAPFVGRRLELSLLDAALDELDGGRAQAIEIVGAAGIGKTRLLAELAARADARGHIVLGGAGADLERDLPFRVFVDALDEYLTAVEPRRLANLDEDVRVELAHIFPSLSDLGRGGSPGVLHERYRTNRAVRELLERLAATKPLVLVLDDVHWADPASVDLAASLLHRPPAAGVLMVLASRPNHSSPRLRSATAQALRAGRLTRIELDPLTGEEAAAMLGREPSDAGAALLYQESGGNPFYLEQLARASDVAGGATPGAEVSISELRVPAMVVAALDEELVLLSDGGRRVLEGASVAGDPFEPELAAVASDVDEPEAMDAVDELLSADLIRLTSVPRRFGFRHPIVRRAVYEASPAAWRIGAHARVAEALADRGVGALARAQHVDASAKVGDAAAVATLTEAARQSAQRAPATAARWFSGALRLLPETAAAEQRVELLSAGATSLAATGRFAEAHEALVEGLGLVGADATALRVQLVAACARVERLLGRHVEAHERLAAALGALPDAGGAVGGVAHARTRRR